MPPLYLGLLLVLLAGPFYVILHAVSLVVPLYLLLLVVGVACLFFVFGIATRSPLDEVFSLVALLVGIACAVIGFAQAPLAVQLLGAIALLVSQQRYRINPPIS